METQIGHVHMCTQTHPCSMWHPLQVSKKHATIRFDGEDEFAWVSDRGSTNKTHVINSEGTHAVYHILALFRLTMPSEICEFLPVFF